MEGVQKKMAISVHCYKVHVIVFIIIICLEDDSFNGKTNWYIIIYTNSFFH